MAWIADAADATVGFWQALNIFGGISGMKAGATKFGNALGYGGADGVYSHLQRWNGTADVLEAQRNGYREYGGQDMTGYGYDSATGLYYDKKTGNYILGHNATGNDNWRGGLTWVGESGPEVVALPSGSQIYSAQESRGMGDVNNYYINVQGIKQLDAVLKWYESRRVVSRM